MFVKEKSWIGAVLGLIILLLGSCATPSSPTGGPPDEEGPRIIRTEPETGTTNFEGQSIILHFSEFVRRASLNEAIVVEPDIGISYNLDWGRKSVEVEFEESIPDSTTLIVTVGTEFEDMNGNGMVSPEKIAVSTGPEIDKGKISGRVINTQTGEGGEGHRILLYREPFELSETANYISSTDTSGTFEFSYLGEGNYKIFWVDDRNRNKVWEEEQERAQPFAQEIVGLEKADHDTVGAVYITSVDTTKLTLQGIGLFSSQRMRMRFSENVELSDSANIAVTDTLGEEIGEAVPLYVQPNEPYILFAHSQPTLDPESSYTVDISGIHDEAGNPIADITQTFTGSAQEDTTRQRIIKRNSLSGYFPTDPLEITYAKPIEEPEIRDSLKVVESDTLLEDWPSEVEQNILRILPKNRWKDGVQYEVRVWDPRIEDYRKFNPEIWHESEMGSLNIMMEDSTAKNIRLQIENEESGITRDTTFAGQILIENLPPLNYTVRVFQDQNSNNSWDYGRVEPFVKPEPYFIRSRVPVKKGFTGDLTIEFKN